MKKQLLFTLLIAGSTLTLWGQSEKTMNNSSNGMPNRISMNVTVAKQTQGATFGEKINAGLHSAGGAYIIFPNKQAFIATQNKVTEMTPSDIAKVNSGIHAAGSAISQGTSLLGGALPGGAVISAAITSVDGSKPLWEIKDSREGFTLPSNLADGEYQLTVTVREKSTSGLKDTLKTQVRLGIKVEGRTYKVTKAQIC